MKIEQDRAEILAGVMHGADHRRAGGAAHREPRLGQLEGPATGPPLTVPRPGHADLAGALKYGLDDVRPVLERASARETAARVAVGAVARALAGRVRRAHRQLCGRDRRRACAACRGDALGELFALAEASDVRCPDAQAAQAHAPAHRRGAAGGR